MVVTLIPLTNGSAPPLPARLSVPAETVITPLILLGEVSRRIPPPDLYSGPAPLTGPLNVSV